MSAIADVSAFVLMGVSATLGFGLLKNKIKVHIVCIYFLLSFKTNVFLTRSDNEPDRQTDSSVRPVGQLLFQK